MNTTVDVLRERLRRELQRQGHGAQRALARAIGVSDTHLSQFLKGKKQFSLDVLDRIAAHFDTTPAALLTPFDETAVAGTSPVTGPNIVGIEGSATAPDISPAPDEGEESWLMHFLHRLDDEVVLALAQLPIEVQRELLRKYIRGAQMKELQRRRKQERRELAAKRQRKDR